MGFLGMDATLIEMTEKRVKIPIVRTQRGPGNRSSGCRVLLGLVMGGRPVKLPWRHD